MKKSFTLLFALAAMTLTNNAKAEVFEEWNGIDKIEILQDIDVSEAKTIYLINENELTYKNGKKDPKQDAVVAKFAKYVKCELEDVYRKTKIEIVEPGTEAPADGILIEFGMKDIDWGSAALRQLGPIGTGGMHCKFVVKITNQNGEVCFAKHERYQSTVFTSAKGPAVVERFSKTFTEDLITILENL